jgi:hypothetical protein
MTRTTLSRSAASLATGALLVAAVACETTVTDAPVPVASIVVSAPRTSIEQGETLQLTATPRSASGRAMTARPVSWTSSNNSVLTVNASGLATATGPGVATVIARSESAENAVEITVTTPMLALTIRNLLVGSITVNVNAQPIGTVNALSTRVFEMPRPANLVVDWDLVRQQTTTGTEIGEPIGGIFAAEPDPPAAVAYDIDNVIVDAVYFAPFITNESPVPYLMGVNMGLVAENRCPCEVPAFASNVLIGYYEFVQNSNVRAYRSGSNYTGTYVFWENFAANIVTGSGRLNLVSNLVPTAAAAPGEVRVAASSPPELPASAGPVRRDDRPRDRARR